MADWRDIYSEIDEKIRANGIKAVSGKTLNGTLKGMIEAVNENLPKAGKGLNDSAGTFMRDLSIDATVQQQNSDIGWVRACKLPNTNDGGESYYGANVALFSTYIHPSSALYTDLLLINLYGGYADFSVLCSNSQETYRIEVINNEYYLCVNKAFASTYSFSVVYGAGAVQTESLKLADFSWYQYAEEPATGTIIAPVRISEPPLPATPENPETKFLNGNREWVEAGVILPITTTTLSGNATWNIDDLKNMMKVVLSGSTNTITLPNGGENPFRFQLIVAQDSTGSRALTISGVSGVNVYNPSEFDFSGGEANQICVCTIIWDGTEYIYECTNYVGGE